MKQVNNLRFYLNIASKKELTKNEQARRDMKRKELLRKG